MTKELTTTNNALSEYDDGLDDGFADNDLVVPRMHIVQSTSHKRKDEGGEEGCFFNSLTKENHRELRIIPMTAKLARTNFPQGADRPVCASNDGVHPASWIESPVCDVCTRMEGRRRIPVCPAVQWVNDANGSTPPECAEKYVLLAVEEDIATPFILDLGGKNYKPTKGLFSAVRLKRRPLWSVSCLITLTKTRNAYGSSYVIDFGGYNFFDEGSEALMRAKELFEGLRGAVDATQQAEETLSDNAATDDDIAF